jgi:co-chaperonin GroES (HSP10)
MIEVPGCRILIRPFKVEENDKAFMAAKAAGIALPEMAERKLQSVIDKGTVLQIGPTASQDYVQGVSVGDQIGFTKFGGKFVRDLNSDEDLLIINDEDVICIFKADK